MKNAFLIGDKTYLRPIDKDDAPALAAGYRARELTRSLPGSGPMNLAQEEDLIKKWQANEPDVILGIAPRGEARLIGCLGLHQTDLRNRHAVFGIAVGDKTYW